MDQNEDESSHFVAGGLRNCVDRFGKPSDIKEAISKIIDGIPDESDQIDAIARVRGWFQASGDAYSTIKAYSKGDLDVASAVNKIAEPIEIDYSTANGGRALRAAEEAAADQRQYCETPEIAEERWGLPQEFPEDDHSARSADDDHELRSAEGLLWELWFSMLHVAKQIPWTDHVAQGRLPDLTKALKARPDPPPPTNMTTALKQNWVWSSGTLWSDLLMLGPSARESWNDAPFGSKWISVPEIHAWRNVNAYLALLTANDVADFWLYAVWALRDALEEAPAATNLDATVPAATNLDATVPAAAVWVCILGKGLYDREEDLTPDDPRCGSPAIGGELWTGMHGFCKGRWALWKERFGVVQDMDDLAEETREIAREAFSTMEQIESGIGIPLAI